MERVTREARGLHVTVRVMMLLRHGG